MTPRRVGRRAVRAAAAGALLGLAATPHAASAHALAPSLLELREDAAGRVAVRWRTPRLAARGAALAPQLPARCAPAGGIRPEADAAFVGWRAEVECGPGGIAGAEIGVAGLAETRTLALVSLRRADGEAWRTLLSGAEPIARIPTREPAAEALLRFFRAGAAHLASGPDHLLFVAGLLLLLRSARARLLAVSAFTAGHGVTLGLAAAGALALPPAAVEIAIAATLVLVALEATRARPGVLGRRPAAVAFGFGLVHGLGFAGALLETGWPRESLPLALAGFHLGIEAAQLGFVALAALTVAIVRAAGPPHAPARGAALVAHLVGGAGVYWLLDRLL